MVSCGKVRSGGAHKPSPVFSTIGRNFFIRDALGSKSLEDMSFFLQMREIELATNDQFYGYGTPPRHSCLFARASDCARSNGVRLFCL